MSGDRHGLLVRCTACDEVVRAVVEPGEDFQCPSCGAGYVLARRQVVREARSSARVAPRVRPGGTRQRATGPGGSRLRLALASLAATCMVAGVAIYRGVSPEAEIETRRGSRCVGSRYCDACISCVACDHCAGRGGTCGTCGQDEEERRRWKERWSGLYERGVKLGNKLNNWREAFESEAFDTSQADTPPERIRAFETFQVGLELFKEAGESQAHRDRARERFEQAMDLLNIAIDKMPSLADDPLCVEVQQYVHDCK